MSEIKTTDELIEEVRSRGYFVRKNPNRYDRRDVVERVTVLLAGPLKFAAYRVRDIETDEWSKLQFHMTHDNTVMAVMGEEAAKLFCRLVNDALDKTVLADALLSERNKS